MLLDPISWPPVVMLLSAVRRSLFYVRHQVCGSIQSFAATCITPGAVTPSIVNGLSHLRGYHIHSMRVTYRIIFLFSAESRASPPLSIFFPTTTRFYSSRCTYLLPEPREAPFGCVHYSQQKKTLTICVSCVLGELVPVVPSSRYYCITSAFCVHDGPKTSHGLPGYGRQHRCYAYERGMNLPPPSCAHPPSFAHFSTENRTAKGFPGTRMSPRRKIPTIRRRAGWAGGDEQRDTIEGLSPARYLATSPDSLRNAGQIQFEHSGQLRTPTCSAKVVDVEGTINATEAGAQARAPTTTAARMLIVYAVGVRQPTCVAVTGGTPLGKETCVSYVSP